jgi:ribonuclease E
MHDAPPGAAESGDGQTRRRRRGGRGGRGGERGERGERAPRENVAAEAVDNRAAPVEGARDAGAERDHGSAHQQPQHQIERGNAMPEQRAESVDAPMYDPRKDDEDTPREPVLERTQELFAPTHEPKLAYSSAAPPREFQAVSEHDAVAEEAHRPQRKRREATHDASQPQPLQLVETQAEAPPIAIEDDAPRRSKPRRRRSGPVEAEPLMLVETDGNADTPRADGAPTP